jgi:type IV secretory pathway VirB3-like protein
MDEKLAKHYTYSQQLNECLKKNWLINLTTIMCVFLISKNIIIGYITINAIMFYFYFSHKLLHLLDNTFISKFLTYAHQYHHSNDGTTYWFVKSILIECFQELICGFSIIIFF